MTDQWIAVYQRHGQIEAEACDDEQDGLDYLHNGEEDGEHVMVSLLGPDKKWTKAEIDRHFEVIYQRDHAEEIAEQKRKVEEAKAAHQAWLAQQPPWKRDRLSDAEITRDGGHVRVVLQGVELPFIVEAPEFKFDSGRGPYMRLDVPIDGGLMFESSQDVVRLYRQEAAA